MYSNLSKGLMATPLAAVLPQTGNDFCRCHWYFDDDPGHNADCG